LSKKRGKENDSRLAALSQSERRRLSMRARKLKSAAAKEDARSGVGRREKSPKSWRELQDEDSPIFERSRTRPRRSVKELMIKLIDEEAREDSTGRSAGTAAPESVAAEPSGDAWPHDRDAVGTGGALTDDNRADEVAERQSGRNLRATQRTPEPDRIRRGTVLSSSSGVCTVLSGEEEVRCILPAEIASVQRSGLAVGDEIAFITRGDGGGVLTSVLPRRTILSRPDPLLAERERVIACNIDAVVIVCSVKAPPLRVRLIDRFLIAVQRGGAEPVLCVNKIDLPDSEEGRANELAKLEPYRAIGLPIVLTSAEAGIGLDDLRRAIRGRRCVFVGHSGVGKSSLLNAIDPELDIATKQLSEATRRGRHTTTASTLYRLPDGAEVIDTPGIRQFGLWDLKRGELRWYFPEFAEHAEACRFRDCTHTREPDCGVRRATAQGGIPAARYDTYQRILYTLAE
jgi:ribosome biogenesis GTPase / thiamine phosphate phosphatase